MIRGSQKRDKGNQREPKGNQREAKGSQDILSKKRLRPERRGLLKSHLTLSRQFYRYCFVTSSSDKKRQAVILKVSINYNGPIKAPINKDEIVGKLIVSYKNTLIGEYDLLAFENIKKINIFSRLLKNINFLIWGDV